MDELQVQEGQCGGSARGSPPPQPTDPTVVLPAAALDEDDEDGDGTSEIAQTDDVSDYSTDYQEETGNEGNEGARLRCSWKLLLVGWVHLCVRCKVLLVRR